MDNLHLVTGFLGREHIKATDQAAFNAALIGTGHFVLDKGNVFEAQVISNNQIRVLDGELMMQGRFIRLDPGTYVDLFIENGVNGVLRNDLIAVRYTKDTFSGVESVNLVVIKGESVESDPVDPAYTEGDITNGVAILHEYPLWRIPIVGIHVGTPEPMFGEPFMDSMRTLPFIRKQVEDIHSEVDEQLADYDARMQEKIDGLVSYTKEETLSDETKTLFGFDEAATPDGVFDNILGKLGVKLWENASPTSNFPQQKIYVDVAAFDVVMVVGKASTTADLIMPITIAKQSEMTQYSSALYYTEKCRRHIHEVTATYINFSAGVGSNGVDDSSAIPIRIYGIKGVS